MVGSKERRLVVNLVAVMGETMALSSVDHLVSSLVARSDLHLGKCLVVLMAFRKEY